MLAKSLLVLGLHALLSSAAPPVKFSSRQTTSSYPSVSQSAGFFLVANVTDPGHDLSPSINGWFFQAYHTGAGQDIAALHAVDADNPGRVFYLNGTAAQVGDSNTTVLTDAGTPSFPYGLNVQGPVDFEVVDNSTDEHAVTVDVGPGTAAGIAGSPEPYPFLTNGLFYGSFLACNRTVAYYEESFVTLEYAYAALSADTGDFEVVIPTCCTSIKLIPQCTDLNALERGASQP